MLTFIDFEIKSQEQWLEDDPYCFLDEEVKVTEPNIVLNCVYEFYSVIR